MIFTCCLLAVFSPSYMRHYYCQQFKWSAFLYPSHSPLRFITSHSRFALASAMRKTKRLRRRLINHMVRLVTWANQITEFGWWKARRCASRDSTNQNASIEEWLSRSERAVFRGICGEIFALFQACVGNFDTIPLWKVVGILYLDSSCVTFKYFAFLSVCDKFELLGHVQAAMMIWVLFLPFFLDLLLVTVSGFIELFWPSCYFNLSSLQISGSTRVYPC